MSINEVKEEEKSEGVSSPPFQGRRTKKNLTVTGDLRKTFQEGNKREQKLPVTRGLTEKEKWN